MQKQTTSPNWYTALAIAAITFAVYFPTRHFPFHFDDIGNITQNFGIRSFDVWARMIASRRWFGEWLNALIFQFDGFSPQYYRLCNIGMHIISGMLVFFLISWICNRTNKDSITFTQRPLIAALTSALFLLHPVQTQTVSYAIQGKLEGGASLLILASLCCMLPALTSRSLLSKLTGLAGALLFGLVACGTKEIAIVAPALLLIIDYFFIANQQWRSMLSRAGWHLTYGGSIGLLMLYYFKPSFFITVFSLQASLPNTPGNLLSTTGAHEITPIAFMISQFKALVHYLWMFVWPFNISVEYDWQLARHILAPDALLPLLLLIGIGGYALRAQTRQHLPYLSFGFAWFFTTMAPRTSLIASQELIVDYKTYLASVGWLFVLAIGIVHLIRFAHRFYLHNTPLRALHYPVLGIACLSLAAGTHQRNQVWENNLSFWHDIVVKSPNKPRAHNNYGVQLVDVANELMRQGNKEEAQPLYAQAIQSYKQAILLDPHTYPDPYSNLSLAYTILEDLDNAVEVAQKAIAIFPEHPEAHLNLGTQLLEKKEYASAEKALNQALKCRPHYGMAHYNLARLHREQGEHDKAWHAYKAASEADFDTVPECWLALGRESLKTNRTQAAITALEKYQQVDIAPTPERERLGQTYLANAYQQSSEFNKAANLYALLAKNNPNKNIYLHNLAECFFACGQLDEAQHYFDVAARCSDAGFYTHLRLAHCFEKKGDYTQAATVLSDIMHTQGSEALPEDMLTTCRTELQRINTAGILASRTT